VKRWVAFLRNHKDDIAAMDSFTVPTASLRLLWASSSSSTAGAIILNFTATFHPTSTWVMQQLREAFPYDTAPRYLVFDRDSIFSPAVVEFIRAMHTKPVRISYRSPWQNGPLSAGLGTVVASSSNTSSSLANGISSGSYACTSATTGPLPLGSRQRRSERETGHATSVTRGEGRRAAVRRWTAPSVRMARGSVATFFRRIRSPES